MRTPYQAFLSRQVGKLCVRSLRPASKERNKKERSFILKFLFFLDLQCFSCQERLTAFTAADQCCSQRVNAPFFLGHTSNSLGGKESPSAIWQGTMGLSLGKGPLPTTT